METYLEMILMAVIQGVTEFLPVSSSGHLAAANLLFQTAPQETIFMTVALHAGTLFSILWVYRREILDLFTRANRRLALLMLLTMIPTGLIGVVFEATHWNDALAENPLTLGLCFWITAAMLWFTLKDPEKLPGDGSEVGVDMKNLPFVKALWIGAAQGIAILSGVSRSGSTISAAAACGMKRSQTATFSFLISIPAVAGAVGVKVLSALHKASKSEAGVSSFWQNSDSFLPLLAGVAVSAFVGYFALRGLIVMLRRGKLRYFGIYCFLMGLILIIWGMCAASVELNPPLPFSPPAAEGGSQ